MKNWTLPNRQCLEHRGIGNSYDTHDQCLAAAIETDGCGNSVMFQFDFECYCCNTSNTVVLSGHPWYNIYVEGGYCSCNKTDQDYWKYEICLIGDGWDCSSCNYSSCDGWVLQTPVQIPTTFPWALLRWLGATAAVLLLLFGNFIFWRRRKRRQKDTPLLINDSISIHKPPFSINLVEPELIEPIFLREEDKEKAHEQPEQKQDESNREDGSNGEEESKIILEHLFNEDVKINSIEFNRWCQSEGYLKAYSTKQFVDRVVKPMCEKNRCRLTDVVPNLKAKDYDVKWKGYYFISHMWSAPLSELSVPFGLPVFIDCMVINQVEEKQLKQDLAMLADFIQKAACLVMLVDPKGKIFTRIWCLFELFTAIHCNVDVVFYCSDKRLQKPGFWQHIGSQFRGVAKAEATKKEDRTMILRHIERQFGYDEADKKIREKLLEKAKQLR